MADLYPIKSNSGSTIFTIKNLLIIGLIIVIIFLLTCKGKRVDKPVVITGQQVHNTIAVIDNNQQRISDSLTSVINQLTKQVNSDYSNYLKVLNENAVLQNENKLLSIYVPDSCKELQALWVKMDKDLKAASDKANNACKTTINTLNKNIAATNKLAGETKKSYILMKAIADTCSKALSTMEKYAKKLEPKREVLIDVNLMSGYDKFKPELGLELGLRSKKGTTYKIGYYTNNLISVGVSKTLFKF